MKTRIVLALSVIALLASREPGFGLRTEPAPIVDSPIGIAEVLRHPSQVYSLEVTGDEFFYFQATPAEINELMKRFAKARMRDHVIRIQAGTNTVKAMNGTTFEYNVSLAISGPFSLAIMRERATEDTLDPALMIYVGADHASLQQLNFPDRAIVECNIPGVDLKGKQARLKRQAWHGEIQFEDGKPAADSEHGVSTTITLWEKDFPDGIPLDKVSIKGFFQAVFSEEEIAALKEGRSWLTMTVGNWAVKAKRDDPRFDVAKLARGAVPVELQTFIEPGNLTNRPAGVSDVRTPQRVTRPAFYYGRVLFEDGTPPVLDRSLWKGENIWVDFSFNGPARPDSEGYFKVTFTPEQVEQMKAQKPRNYIYVPNREGAIQTFPFDLLSTDKAKAGVVRIAKPVFPYDSAKAPSLLGQALPDVTALNLAATDAPAGQPMIVLLIDAEQRPSRRTLKVLTDQASALKEKRVSVVILQATSMTDAAYASWLKESALPFPVARLKDTSEKSRVDWGARSLPWLILADKNHRVAADGFPIEELEAKLKEMAK